MKFYKNPKVLWPILILIWLWALWSKDNYEYDKDLDSDVKMAEMETRGHK